MACLRQFLTDLHQMRINVENTRFIGGPKQHVWKIKIAAAAILEKERNNVSGSVLDFTYFLKKTAWMIVKTQFKTHVKVMLIKQQRSLCYVTRCCVSLYTVQKGHSTL